MEISEEGREKKKKKRARWVHREGAKVKERGGERKITVCREERRREEVNMITDGRVYVNEWIYLSISLSASVCVCVCVCVCVDVNLVMWNVFRDVIMSDIDHCF